MNKADILHTAMEQSALECGCCPEDFLRSENMVVTSRPDRRARVYLELPQRLDLCSYGHNVVASCSEPFRQIAAEYIGRIPFYRCFETPCLQILSQMVRPLGCDVCFMAEYWLCPTRMPSARANVRIPCGSYRRKNFGTSICPNGRTRSAATVRSMTALPSAHMTGTGWSEWRGPRPTAKRCGRSASTSCRTIGCGASPRR